MKVSVIIPSYRHEHIIETFQSLFRQTIQPHEILYEYSRDLNAAEKINRLASIATGDAILIVSDDDLLDRGFIEKTVHAMSSTESDIVYTDMLKFGESTPPVIVMASNYNYEAFKSSTVPWFTSLIRKSFFEKVGGWDKDQDYQDYDFYYRCFKAGAKGFHLKEPLFHYRIHPESGSFNMSHDIARQKMKAKHPEIL